MGLTFNNETIVEPTNDIILKMYPVGSIYLSVNNTNPQILFGGEWERIQDKFLLSAGSTYSAGSSGGSATHTLTVNELPSHNHLFTGSAVTSGTSSIASTGNQSANHTHTFTTGNQSAGHTHSIPALSGTAASNGEHAHSARYTSQQVANGTGKAYYNSQGDKTSSGMVVSSGAHTHAVTTTANTTGGISANHTHSGTTGNNSVNHTHSMSHTHSVTASGTISNTGNGEAINTLPPYLTVYMWKRTA